MSEKIDQIVEDLKTLTLLEASELVSKIEETFGVDASAAAGGDPRPKPDFGAEGRHHGLSLASQHQ